MIIYQQNKRTAYDCLCRLTYSEHFSQVFKIITTDNGSEFSRLSELEELAETLVFYTHPYTSCEKGTNERHNGIIRRFIPKGKRISDFDVNYISDIEIWCYSLPRKILNYRTPDEVFEDELDLIYRQTASLYGFLVINVQLIIAVYGLIVMINLVFIYFQNST